MNFFYSEIKTNLENTKQLEKDFTEERSRYQSLLSKHLQLEERHKDLKEEMNVTIVRKIFLLCMATEADLTVLKSSYAVL